MKNSNFVTAALFCLSFFFAVNLSAQYGNNVSYSNGDFAPTLAIETLKIQMAELGYTCASDDYFTITEGSEKHKARRLYAGTSYVFMNVPTESGLLDTDITVKSTSGRILAKDADTDPSCIVEFEPSYNMDVKIWVKNYDSVRRGYGYDSRLLVFFK